MKKDHYDKLVKILSPEEIALVDLAISIDDRLGRIASILENIHGELKTQGEEIRVPSA